MDKIKMTANISIANIMEGRWKMIIVIIGFLLASGIGTAMYLQDYSYFEMMTSAMLSWILFNQLINMFSEQQTLVEEEK